MALHAYTPFLHAVKTSRPQIWDTCKMLHQMDCKYMHIVSITREEYYLLNYFNYEK